MPKHNRQYKRKSQANQEKKEKHTTSSPETSQIMEKKLSKQAKIHPEEQETWTWQYSRMTRSCFIAY